MSHKIVSPLASALGVLLIILSFVWPNATDRNAVWSVEQQQERGEAIREAHRLSDRGHGGSDHGHAQPTNASRDRAAGAPGHDALEKAKERVNRSNAALQKARAGQQGIITFLKWSGVFLVAVGAIVFAVKRNAEN